MKLGLVTGLAMGAVGAMVLMADMKAMRMMRNAKEQVMNKIEEFMK